MHLNNYMINLFNKHLIIFYKNVQDVYLLKNRCGGKKDVYTLCEEFQNFEKYFKINARQFHNYERLEELSQDNIDYLITTNRDIIFSCHNMIHNIYDINNTHLNGIIRSSLDLERVESNNNNEFNISKNIISNFKFLFNCIVRPRRLNFLANSSFIFDEYARTVTIHQVSPFDTYNVSTLENDYILNITKFRTLFSGENTFPRKYKCFQDENYTVYKPTKDSCHSLAYSLDTFSDYFKYSIPLLKAYYDIVSLNTMIMCRFTKKPTPTRVDITVEFK